ncbi:MAG TPA: CHAD domain-containing protein [Acetobacteraceae bacterium]|nr:CHAD domain-containing protein [Acetobacteraceae bacterium]
MADQTKREPLEVELKLLFPPEARSHVEAHPALAAAATAPPRAERLVTTYFDTPDHRIAGNGFTLRVRRAGDKAIQTVKSDGPAPKAEDTGLARRRGEWEWPVAGDRPDLHLLSDTPLGGLLSNDTAGQLAPVLTTEVTRTKWQLRLEGSSGVEAAVDFGCLRTGGAEEAIHELELELKQGPVGPLYRLALVLQADLPLRIGVESKAGRGYRLASGRLPEPIKTRDPVLNADFAAEDAFRRILGCALDALIGNQPAAAAGAIEGVHQMRVAVRRLRTALVLFGPHLEPHAVAPFNDELQRLGRLLGEHRDWDVFCRETLPAALGGTAGHWRPALMRAAQSERESAHARLEQEFAGPALTRLALALAAWADDESRVLGGEKLRAPLSDVAPALLDGVARKVAKRGRHIGRLVGTDLHDLRKSLKKLRYSVDDLAGLYPPDRVSPYLKRCKHLQALLGEINDAAVAVTLAEQLGRTHPLEIVPGVAAVAIWSEGRRAEAADPIPDAWDEFRDAAPFWR